MKKAVFFILIMLLTIASASFAVSGEDLLKSEAARQLKEDSPWEKGDIEIDEIQVSGLNPQDAFDEVKIKSSGGTKNIGKVTVSATLLKGGKEIKTVWVSAVIKVYKEAVVALSSLKMNQKISSDDVKVVRMEMREMQDAAVSVNEVVGMVVKRPISAGSVIKKEYIKPETVIKRGDRVVVLIDNHKLRIKSAGTATEDGYRGGIISAKADSGKEIRGKVTGPGEMVVEF